MINNRPALDRICPSCMIRFERKGDHSCPKCGAHGFFTMNAGDIGTAVWMRDAGIDQSQLKEWRDEDH